MQVKAMVGVILYSPAPERLVAFYRDILGVPFEAAEHGAVGPHYECLFGRTHFAIWGGGERAGHTVVPSFLVPDVAAAVADAARAGVAVTLAPLDIGDGKRVASILDPGGNTLRLIQLR